MSALVLFCMSSLLVLTILVSLVIMLGFLLSKLIRV